MSSIIFIKDISNAKSNISKLRSIIEKSKPPSVNEPQLEWKDYIKKKKIQYQDLSKHELNRMISSIRVFGYDWADVKNK